MRRSRRFTQFVILVVDVIILFTALTLALIIRTRQFPGMTSLLLHAKPFSLIFVAWILIFYTAGLYNPEKAFDTIILTTRLAVSMGICALIAALYFYLDINTPIEPRTIIVLLTVLSFMQLWLWRYFYGKISRLYFPRLSTAFVGMDESVAELIEIIRTSDHLGYTTTSVFDESPDCERLSDYLCSDRDEFLRAIDEQDVSLVVVTDERRLSEATRRMLFSLIERPVRFMRLPEFYEMLLRKVPVGTINDLWFLEHIDLRAKRPYEVFKRGIDILVALVGLIVSLPLWPLIALGIKLSSPGPVLFEQTRLGKAQVPFTILKFRTMRSDGNDFSPTGEKDPRITTVGTFLRSTRLDELPQLINILVGEMSFVGPRPERPELAAQLEASIPYYRQRLLVKPGLTGWDQVSGEYHSPSIEDTYKKLQYDLYYVKNVSVFLDLSIFFKTIMTVLARAGR